MDKDFERDVISLRLYLLATAHRQFPTADAEDLTQETLLRAWKSWGRYKPDNRLKPWLRTIMFNVFINQYRYEQRLKVFPSLFQDLEDERDDFSHLGRMPSAEQEAMDADTTSEVYAALDSLLPVYREVLKLVAEGYHYKEMAAYLDVPIGTVMSRVHRARAKMREALSDSPYLTANN